LTSIDIYPVIGFLSIHVFLSIIINEAMELLHIKDRIHEVRGMKIMLDFDLAKLYTIETKRLKEAVRRNIRRFPEDFMFELTSNEWENLRTQFASSSWGGKRYRPFAFSEHGIAMLSSVLHSDVAIEINISIMRAFVHIRQWALSHEELAMQLRDLEKRYDQKFMDIEQVLTYLMQKDQQKVSQSNRSKIGFKV
jgi:arabinogalactan endo-1,4-beta-galactosidase